MARYVEDLSLLLPIIAGPDGRDPFICPIPLGDPNQVSLKDLHGGFYFDNGIQTPIPEILEAVQLSVKTLGEAGVVVEETKPPGIEETLDLLTSLFSWDGRVWIRNLLESAGTAFDQSSIYPGEPEALGTSGEFTHLIERWDQFRMGMHSFLNNYDLIIAPVNAYQARLHGMEDDYFAGFSYTMTYNLTGWPAAVVRVSTAQDGIPIGVQIISKPWREDIVLAVAQHLQESLGGWQPPPL
jgi:amidase